MQIKINMKKPTNKQITETLNLNNFTIVCTAPPLPPISAGTWLNLLSDFQKGGPWQDINCYWGSWQRGEE